MKSIKAFFKKMIDKIKGLFKKKEDELPPIRITPVILPVDTPMTEEELIKSDPRWDLARKDK